MRIFVSVFQPLISHDGAALSYPYLHRVHRSSLFSCNMTFQVTLDKPGVVIYMVTLAGANVTSQGGVATAYSILNMSPDSLFAPVPVFSSGVIIDLAGVQYNATVPFLPDARCGALISVLICTISSH